MIRRIGWCAGAIVLGILLNMPATRAEGYVLHGRISYDAGNTLIKAADEGEYAYAAVNSLVLPGDTLWVEDGGTSETEFSHGSFLRMADGSKMELVALPPSLTLRAWTGSFYLQRLKRASAGAVLQTPACQVAVEPNSAVRVDIIGEGATTVSVRWGRAVVRTETGDQVVVDPGYRIWVDPGMLPSNPTPFDRAQNDSFDVWNNERAEALAASQISAPIPVEVDESNLGLNDLASYGEWVYVDSRPYWRPTVVVDYVPYRYGTWNYLPTVGYCWVGNYPFSYITTHHGYWQHHSRYGWIWEYDRPWSPAWASTVRCGNYYVWSPIDRYHRPVYVNDSAYFSIGGVQFSVFGSSFVLASEIGYGYGYCHEVGYYGFDYRHIAPHTVNIWNINIGDRPRVRTPFDSSVTTVRNYFPDRSIRGTRSIGDSNRSATDVARSLETRNGRERFATVERTGGRGERTANDNGVRSAQVRTANVTSGRPEYVRATRDNPVRATERPVITRGSVRERGDGGDPRTAPDSPSIRNRGEAPEAGRTPARGAEGDRGQTRTAKPAPQDSTRGTEARPERAERDTNVDRTTPARGESTAPRQVRPSRSSVPQDNIAPDAGSRNTNAMRTPVRSNPVGTTIRPTAPDAADRTPSREPVREPDARPRTTVTRSPEQSQTPRLLPTVPHQEPAARVQTRTREPQMREPAARQPEYRAPEVRQPRPQQEYRAPEVRQQQQPVRAPEVRQPQPRPQQPQMRAPEPSPRVSAPTVNRESTSRPAPAPQVRQERAPSSRESTGRGR
ncbi:MAG: hypothetical protein HYV27_22885 [Candidatus Hydrogenedentes bacterium]|nr:hypothetical protein [Candidatus Hydrogenedentota bacterium]